jgi:hypothetical protein
MIPTKEMSWKINRKNNNLQYFSHNSESVSKAKVTTHKILVKVGYRDKFLEAFLTLQHHLFRCS